MNKRLFLLGIIVSVVAIAGFSLIGQRTTIIGDRSRTENERVVEDEEVVEGPTGTLTQLPCKHHERRPMAVMLSADAETRPLSGIAAADVVVEMPVVTGLITRYMAVYQCEDAERIGSVRSSRHDFIPMAALFDAIYAHWGGSVLALEELQKGVVDNIDAMINTGRAFWEEPHLARPHAGFTSSDRLYAAADILDYRVKTETVPFRMEPSDDRGRGGTLSLGYPRSFRVSFEYDPETNRYKRFRADTPEIDAVTNEQVAVRNVVVLVAPSRQVLADYNDVTLDGVGPAAVYRNGKEITGDWKWQERPLGTPLRLFDEAGEEIFLTPGKIWISVVEPTQEVQWVGE